MKASELIRELELEEGTEGRVWVRPDGSVEVSVGDICFDLDLRGVATEFAIIDGEAVLLGEDFDIDNDEEIRSILENE